MHKLPILQGFQCTMVFLLGVLFPWLFGNPLNAQPTADHQSQSKQQTPGSPAGLFYGPALIITCRELILQPSSTANLKEGTLKLSEGNQSFEEAKNWISKHVFTALNRPQHNPEVNPPYYLHLFSDRNNGMMGLLISIPLGPETLGPDYSTKLIEFRQLLTAAKPQQGAVGASTP